MSLIRENTTCMAHCFNKKRSDRPFVIFWTSFWFEYFNSNYGIKEYSATRLQRKVVSTRVIRRKNLLWSVRTQIYLKTSKKERANAGISFWWQADSTDARNAKNFQTRPTHFIVKANALTISLRGVAVCRFGKWSRPPIHTQAKPRTRSIGDAKTFHTEESL